MKLSRAISVAMLGAAACAVKASSREPWLELHQHDWLILRDDVYRRRFESAGHFIHSDSHRGSIPPARHNRGFPGAHNDRHRPGQRVFMVTVRP
jgi:hypothetical protein